MADVLSHFDDPDSDSDEEDGMFHDAEGQPLSDDDDDEDGEDEVSLNYLDADSDDDDEAEITGLDKLRLFAMQEGQRWPDMARRAIVQDLAVVLATEEDTEDAIPVIVKCTSKLLKDSESFIRTVAAQSLVELVAEYAKLGTPAAIAGIMEALDAIPGLLIDRPQTRAAGKALFISMFHLNAVDRATLEALVEPLLATLSEWNPASDGNAISMMSDPTDLLVESLSLLTGLCDVVDAQFCKEIFLPRVTDCSTNDSHQARKVCPVAIAALAKVFSGDPATAALNEEMLCPMFEQLVADEIWGVRKCCAESLAAVSEGLSGELKRSTVAGWFATLARDGSRWVRSAAFKKLGALIATYAAPIPAGGLPPVTDDDDDADAACVQAGGGEGDAPTTPVKTPPSSILVDGVTVDASSDDAAAEVPETPPPGGRLMGQNVSPRSMRRQDTPRRLDHMSPDSVKNGGGGGLTAEDSKVGVLNLADALDNLDDESLADDSGDAGDPGSVGGGAAEAAVVDGADLDESGGNEAGKEETESAVVVPAPEVGSDGDNVPVTPKQEFNDIQYWKSPIPAFDIDALLGESSGAAPASADDSSTGTVAAEAEEADEEADEEVAPPRQTVVPTMLIDCFNQMAQAESARTVDIEVARDCAFSFPAILWAVGAAGWPEVRETYFMLASNDDWRVRSTLAHSIHICAQILGRKVTDTDLVSKFDALIDDWDAVKIGVVKHFADFIQVMSPSLRTPYLTRLMDLCETDDATNWRPRRLLAEQICRIAPLCTPALIAQTMSPLAISIALNDGVACVRDYFYKSIAVLVGRLAASYETAAVQELWATIVKDFHSNPKGSHRLGFVKICFHYATEVAPREEAEEEHRSGPADAVASSFAEHVLPPLLEMTGDHVVNVRVGVARLLNRVMVKYSENKAGLHAKVCAALHILKDDMDDDVKYFASEEQGPPPGNPNPNPDANPNPIPNWVCSPPDAGLGDERMAFE